MSVVLHQQGTELTCSAMVKTLSDRLIVAHVPLVVVPCPKTLGFPPLPADDMARHLEEKVESELQATRPL